jgi:hypothetical protein
MIFSIFMQIYDSYGILIPKIAYSRAIIKITHSAKLKENYNARYRNTYYL